VPVQDRYGDLTIDVKKPAVLCNPADVEGTDPGAPLHTEHGVSYQIKTTKDTPKFVKRVNQKVYNPDFGTTFVDVKRPYRLFVPSAKSHVSSPAPIASPFSDHFLCYKISKTAGSTKFGAVPDVTIIDQFETVTVTVVKPTMLCVPVDVNGAQPGADTNPGLQLCYKVKRPQGNKLTPQPGIYINNEYGPLRLDVKKSESLCVPAQIVP
jgi:hypothetical protein